MARFCTQTIDQEPTSLGTGSLRAAKRYSNRYYKPNEKHTGTLLHLLGLRNIPYPAGILVNTYTLMRIEIHSRDSENNDQYGSLANSERP